ncbi:MAG: hypothetical protein LBE50_05600 [Gallionellaceae bacterium]|jgi:hypothetical protein|nr:hypothetical protein [Gallionellaceae bacterium]
METSPVKTYQHHGISLVGGYQMWSNPAAMWTESAIPVVLARPTFLSLVLLAGKFGKGKLLSSNEALFQNGDLSEKKYRRNAFWLEGIADDIQSDSELNIDRLQTWAHPGA